jgi:hypothetical protein
VIATDEVALLGHWRSSELSAPSHQCVVEQSPLFQIFDQRGRALIRLPTHDRQLVDDIGVEADAVVIPSTME